MSQNSSSDDSSHKVTSCERPVVVPIVKPPLSLRSQFLSGSIQIAPSEEKLVGDAVPAITTPLLPSMIVPQLNSAERSRTMPRCNICGSTPETNSKFSHSQIMALHAIWHL